MKNLILPFFILLAIIACKNENSNNSKIVGNIIHEGIIECFEKGLGEDLTELVSCEASAVIYINNELIIASDKNIPGKDKSSVFKFRYPYKEFPSIIKKTSIEYLKNEPFRNVKKIEAFSKSFDSDLIVASTAFNRIDLNSNEYDSLNSLIYWKANKGEVKYIFGSENNGVKSSKGLRKYFSKAIISVKYPYDPDSLYYKIEAMSFAPNNNIVFGVREMGNKFLTREFKFLLISTNYAYFEEELLLDRKFKTVYEYDVNNAGLPEKNIGISSIEYNIKHNAFFILTSFEYKVDESDKIKSNKNDKIGAYLWKLPYKSYLDNKPPILIKNENGKPLVLPHKAEGLTFINDDTLFIICDDDRFEKPIGMGEFKRSLNQAPFYIVKIK